MLHIIVVGTGNIASYWLQHFAPQLPADARVHGITNSRSAQLTTSATPVARQLPDKPGPGHNTEQWVAEQIKALATEKGAEVVVLDLTASKTVSRSYPCWVAAGAHLISANKYAGSAAPDFYRELRNTLSAHRRYWLYNTTVGAGLPIQKAIAERLTCHDKIIQLEGNFSGSLSWIFQQYRRGHSFSAWLREAAELGMTEPDPRVDLSGMDVARKLLILAREAWPQEGVSLQLSDIQIANLVPAGLRDCSLATFWQQVGELDQSVAEATQAAQSHYIGSVSKDADGVIRASARLRPVTEDSPYAHLAPGNANFVIKSRHYDANPLIIQGPGAGREVTAAGIHSDLLQLIALL
ncbi:aspartate kinase [Aliidiomarina soli]|uniref:homoserine dehydrogenase n=1 Tax=Aliidiomarina soli TaxID=1928574 RepID=A0A432WFB8_9GAMM|nr:aspartate kinase [Aliidiomarina soli]RUO32483.1 aspartate kinase [Aliidiomarina soli]